MRVRFRFGACELQLSATSLSTGCFATTPVRTSPSPHFLQPLKYRLMYCPMAELFMWFNQGGVRGGKPPQILNFVVRWWFLRFTFLYVYFEEKKLRFANWVRDSVDTRAELNAVRKRKIPSMMAIETGRQLVAKSKVKFLVSTASI
jgi:hypothetical protein